MTLPQFSHLPDWNLRRRFRPSFSWHVTLDVNPAAAGQTVGLDRPSALEFSFVLSIPTMIAATGWDLIKEVHPQVQVSRMPLLPPAHVVMNGERWLVLIIGIVVSFIVALGVVEWFLHWVRKHGFTVFAIYRILLGITLLIWGARLIAR